MTVSSLVTMDNFSTLIEFVYISISVFFLSFFLFVGYSQRGKDEIIRFRSDSRIDPNEMTKQIFRATSNDTAGQDKSRILFPFFIIEILKNSSFCFSVFVNFGSWKISMDENYVEKINFCVAILIFIWGFYL